MSRIDSSSPYRIQGPLTLTSFAEIAKNKPGFVIAATAEQVAELKLHDEQAKAREAANAQYAEQHPDNIFAQVMQDGKALATIYDSGITVTQQNISGLRLTENGSGKELAKTRLNEVVQALQGGQVIYANFVPPQGPAPATVPDAALPKVTARNLADMAREMTWALERSRMEK